MKPKTKFKQTEIGMIPETDVRKFKNLIKEMYRGFPNSQFRETVEKVIVTEEMRKHLLDSKFLLKEEHVANGQAQDFYMLGPNALPLVSAWETEDLTRSIKKLTWVILAMTTISLILFVIQTLRILGVV